MHVYSDIMNCIYCNYSELGWTNSHVLQPGSGCFLQPKCPWNIWAPWRYLEACIYIGYWWRNQVLFIPHILYFLFSEVLIHPHLNGVTKILLFIWRVAQIDGCESLIINLSREWPYFGACDRFSWILGIYFIHNLGIVLSTPGDTWGNCKVVHLWTHQF